LGSGLFALWQIKTYNNHNIKKEGIYVISVVGHSKSGKAGINIGVLVSITGIRW